MNFARWDIGKHAPADKGQHVMSHSELQLDILDDHHLIVGRSTGRR